MAFFKGFQNPRIPSYFSNTHLSKAPYDQYNEIDKGSILYQSVGSICELVKKQALVGSPISSIVLICLSKNSGGGSLLMGGEFTTEVICCEISGRCALIVAAKLDRTLFRTKRKRVFLYNTSQFVCPTNKEQ